LKPVVTCSPAPAGAPASGVGGLAVAQVSYYNSRVEVRPGARRHGIADEDIEDAVSHAMMIEAQDDETTRYLGPARSASLLEIVTVTRDGKAELAIHAVRMPPRYERLLAGG
jgi:hypothetical protein